MDKQSLECYRYERLKIIQKFVYGLMATDKSS